MSQVAHNTEVSRPPKLYTHKDPASKNHALGVDYVPCLHLRVPALEGKVMAFLRGMSKDGSNPGAKV